MLQTSWKQHTYYFMRPEARARTSASELTDLSCSEQVNRAEFRWRCLSISSTTRKAARARQPRLVFLDRLRVLRLTLYSEQCASSPVVAFSRHDYSSVIDCHRPPLID